MLEQLEKLKAKTTADIAAAADIESLKAIERATVGKKGEITEALRAIPTLPIEERPGAGQRINEIKVSIQAALEARELELEAAALQTEMAAGAIDVTLPGRRGALGRLHPATVMLRDIYRIWGDMGFQVYRSRDVESDDMNFTYLNIPPHHPARDMWDTFYTTKEGVILRTHTSPGQIHAMREYAPDPVRVILPGMVYRYEQVDASHEFQFNQVEGVVVGRNIHLTDLKGTMIEFARRVYGAEKAVRFRCSHFPFTEPSVEIDVEWEGGWMEIGGAGMMHPVVLKNGGYDPREYSGFAFGIGPERILMVKHRIEDIRYFWGNDLRFLQQF